jgi:hypothetical protein
MKEDNEKNELTPIEKGFGPALGIAGGLLPQNHNYSDISICNCC